MSLLSPEQLRARITRLAAIERGSASPGERQAAELIADELRDSGAGVRLEEETAHGSYWWPVGALTAAAALAAVSGRRGLATVVGTLAAAGVADDISGGSQWFRRRLLPQRRTVNVVAEVGPARAPTVVFVAHHDAAHSGLVFHPELARWALRRYPALLERAHTTPPTMWGAVAGPALVALGGLLGGPRTRALGGGLSAGYVAAMIDIGLRGVVPGANDNLSGVAVLLSLAASLQAAPVPAARVLLVSTGSEESFMEGMQAFARRHFSSLPPETTHVICIDTVGSPDLLVLEGEGMLAMRDYPKDLIATVRGCADELGIFTHPGLRLRNATDGLIALRAGYPTATIGSVDRFKVPSNYHWPTDTADNVDYGTVADAARLCRAVLERLAGTSGAR